MFDYEFYPTPKSVIRKMLEGINRHELESLTILEPSAGRGDIADYIKANTHGEHSRVKIYVCEIDKDLQYQLQSKGYRLISEDFLHYKGDYYFDLIIMNPPFSAGVDHLLKAWEILDEGQIICLLNAETIKNPFSEKRILLKKIIDDNASSIEYLGSVFEQAERETSTEIALVKIRKEAAVKSKLNFEFASGPEKSVFDLDENLFKNEIAVRDVVGNMMIQYERLKGVYVDYLKVKDGLDYYSQGLFNDLRGIGTIMDEVAAEVGKRNSEAKPSNMKYYNEFCDKMKYEIWKTVIEKMGMERYLTNNVRKNFQKFVEQQGAMDFTKENVMNLIKTLFANTKNIMETAIAEVFDHFTKYHEENRCHIEGWKTNSAWRVNLKVILPNFVDATWFKTYHINSHRWDEYSDIDRVMSYLSGKKYEEIKTLKSAIESIRIGDNGLYESEFFTFRCYKKGTLHIKFKDEWLWEEFNLRATDGKKWLPEEVKNAWEQKIKNKKVA